MRSTLLYAIFRPGATAGAQFPPSGQPPVSAVQQISKRRGQRNGRGTASTMSGRMREKNRPYTIGGRPCQEAMPAVPGSRSTECSEFCEPKCPGQSRRKRMETGRGCTVGSVGGVTGKSERRFQKSRWITGNLGYPPCQSTSGRRWSTGRESGHEAHIRGLTPRHIWLWMHMICRCDFWALPPPQRIQD